jgi:hypothetical protein
MAGEKISAHGDNNQPAYFVLNVRAETLAGGRVEWRGEVLHVDSNTVSAFEDWPELVELIAGALTGACTSTNRHDMIGAREML